MIGHIIGWIIAGLIIGAIARLLVPGRQNMGIGMTIVLGIVGAVVGGFLGSLLFRPDFMTDASGTYTADTAWPGWIMSIIGGVLVLVITMAVTGGSRTPGSRLP